MRNINVLNWWFCLKSTKELFWNEIEHQTDLLWFVIFLLPVVIITMTNRCIRRWARTFFLPIQHCCLLNTYFYCHKDSNENRNHLKWNKFYPIPLFGPLLLVQCAHIYYFDIHAQNSMLKGPKTAYRSVTPLIEIDKKNRFHSLRKVQWTIIMGIFITWVNMVWHFFLLLKIK